MDILAARKKAAEKEKARTGSTPAETPPASQAKQEDALPAMDGRTAAAAATVQAPLSTERAAPAAEDARESAPSAPDVAEEGAAAPVQQTIELLAFRLGGEQYAVKVADVQEVLKNYQLTIVPNTPDHILGVMSLRGTMLPVIDLCKRFGLASGVEHEKTRIIVVRSDDESTGLLVDRVTGVIRVLPDEIKPVPENIEQGAEFLSGIVRKDDKLTILLDLNKAAGA